MEYLGNIWQQPIYKSSFIFSPDFGNISDEVNVLDRKNLRSYLSSEKGGFSTQLKHIAEEIELSKDILELEEGWDGYDTPPVPHFVFQSSISFLKDYAHFIFKNIGIAIDAPEINPGRNENVFLSWRTENARLAISIEQNNGELIANYYGDLKNSQPIKGCVTISEVSEYLAFWMKNLI